jgi:ABC-2 type transport system permease protein
LKKDEGVPARSEQEVVAGVSASLGGAPAEVRSVSQVDRSPLHGLWALTKRDLRKWYLNPFQLMISLIQPVVWLGLFGKALNFGAFISGAGGTAEQQNLVLQGIFGTTSYFSFLACGMLAFIILGTSAFAGMSVVFDKRFGFMNKALSTPVGRGAIVVGKVLQSVVRSLIQAGVVLAIAVALGMDTSHFTMLGIIGTFSALFLMAFALSSLFVMTALRSSEWQTQMAIINLLNMPLMFASNALLPVKLMPTWLQYVVESNPVSYANDATRQLMIGAVGFNSLAVDFAVLGVFAAILAVSGIVMSWRLLSK